MQFYSSFQQALLLLLRQTERLVKTRCAMIFTGVKVSV
jgi:hypothetical protein